MRANSLARFHEAFGQPAHALMLFDLARGIELVYALERAMEILAEPLDQEDTDVPYTPRDGEGHGLVEAPRGPLIHHYRIEKGLIAGAEFVIPTVHNVMAIERALRVAAERYITPDLARSASRRRLSIYRKIRPKARPRADFRTRGRVREHSLDTLLSVHSQGGGTRPSKL
jgi:coenzyme F420-reducing hydrogenase alpha subunit